VTSYNNFLMILHIAMVLLLILFFFGYLVGFFYSGKTF